MSEDSGLICAYAFMGEHDIRELDWPDIRNWKPGQGWIWIHLDLSKESSRQWLDEKSGLDELVLDALLADRTRPRMVQVGEGLMATLHGVNLNFEAAPEDMISIRVWADENRVITLRSPHSRAIQDVRDSILVGKGPEGPSEFLVSFLAALTERMDPVLGDLEKEADRLHGSMPDGETAELRPGLGGLRLKAVLLRRHILPQLDVASRLEETKIPWIGKENLPRLNEITDRLIRYVEDLDALIDRGAALQDELATRLSEGRNRALVVLALTAGMFMPLLFVMALMSNISLGYVTGFDNYLVYAMVFLALVLTAGLSAWILRRLKKD